MNDTSLKMALMVLKSGSIAEAARILDLDPSSLSRSLSQLESSLGFRLFHRTTRKLSATEEGATYLGRMEPLLDEMAQIEEEVRSLKQEPRGTLRMTSSVALGTICIIPALEQFRKQWPAVKLDLHLTDQNVDLAAEGLDLALRLAPAPSGQGICRKLSETHYVICATPEWQSAHALHSPQELEKLECLQLSLPDHRHQWHFKHPCEGSQSINVKGSLSISNPLALRQACLQGLGPAMLANWLVAEDIKAGRLVRLLPDFACTATDFGTSIYGLYPSRSYIPTKTRLALDYFGDIVKKACQSEP